MSRRQILIYAPLAILGPHFETDLEVAQNHLDDNDNVTIVTCAGELKILGFESCKGTFRCATCVSRQKAGLALLQKKSSPLEILPISDLVSKEPQPQIPALPEPTHAAWMNFSVDKLDCGAAALSTLVSNLREPVPYLANYINYFKESVRLQIKIYNAFIQYFEKNKIDLVYFFNGRFSLYRPVLRACQKKEITFYTHERGAKLSLYHLSKNTYPHDIEYRKNEILEMWSTVTPAAVDESHQWFKSRGQYQGVSWYSFSDQQVQSADSLKINKSKRNIAVFISSEDELSCITGWENPLFANQNLAVEWLGQEFLDVDHVHFYIRIHPNLAGLKNSQTIFLNNFKSPSITTIPANSPISSYNLIEACDAVITFSSTIGVEASYLNKVSILCGRAFYEHLDVCYCAQSVEHLKQLILDNSLQPKNRLNTLPYGNWVTHFGQTFKFYQPINLSVGTFNGQLVNPNFLLKYTNYFESSLRVFVQMLKGQISFKNFFRRIRNKIT